MIAVRLAGFDQIPVLFGEITASVTYDMMAAADDLPSRARYE
jgi:hypothetical protein